MPLDLKGKLAVVTGASSGIGRAIALELASLGMRLELLGRDEARLAAVATDVARRGGDARLHSFDLGDDAAVLSFAERIGEGLDVLVHSAGVITLGTVAELEVDVLDWHYRLNVRAPYLLSRACLGALTRRAGQLAFINSGAGLSARAGWSAYAASKHALKAIADSLREELAGTGVRVISVYPGRTASPMQQRVRESEGASYHPEAFVQPEDIARQLGCALQLARGAGVTDLSVRPSG